MADVGVIDPREGANDAATANAVDPAGSSPALTKTPASDPAPDEAARLIALAAIRLERGDARTALAAASEACHRAPHLPQAHYVYGQAWAALGNQANAE